MGIPNYAYDWPLPFEQGITEAETIGNLQAVRRAVFYGAEILYDEQSQAPYFTIQGKAFPMWYGLRMCGAYRQSMI